MVSGENEGIITFVKKKRIEKDTQSSKYRSKTTPVALVFNPDTTTSDKPVSVTTQTYLIYNIGKLGVKSDLTS